jgi:DNA-binding XRE family transcriptional regulator
LGRERFVLAVAAPAGSLQTLLVDIRSQLTQEQLEVTRGPRQRLDAGVTQEQVARALGISLRYYTAVETGSASPSLDLLRGLVRVLDLDSRQRMAVLDAVLG